MVGKTYSLYGDGNNSDGYYALLHTVANQCLTNSNTPEDLLSLIRRVTKNKRRLRRISRASVDSSEESFLLHTLSLEFSPFTTSVAVHLRDLPLAKRWDWARATSKEQYHLYMLEIELQNRLDAKAFHVCDTKLAFLPHCLHDLTVECKSVIRGEDYVCKGCSRTCNINAVFKLLRRNGIQPYIWMTANLRTLFKRLKREGRHVGVLGIACIPELVRGMRMCVAAEVPVVGIPLDANRCARWWGEFHPNTVNLAQIERWLGERTLKSTSASA